jgi:hypothetical protein
MATIVFMLTGAVAEGFLLYALTQVTREMKKARATRAATAAIPISRTTGEQMAGGRKFAKVIEITDGSRVASQTGSRRMAS